MENNINASKSLTFKEAINFQSFLESTRTHDNKGYIDSLLVNNYFNEESAYYNVFEDDKNIGFVIIANYNKHEHSAIIYLYFYKEVDVLRKKILIEKVVNAVDNNEFENLYLRVPEENQLLKKAVEDLNFTVSGGKMKN